MNSLMVILVWHLNSLPAASATGGRRLLDGDLRYRYGARLRNAVGMFRQLRAAAATPLLHSL